MRNAAGRLDAKIVMELLKVKTARFRDLVSQCGAPEVVTLWGNPQTDRHFQKALREQRILSVHQSAVGTRKDFGEVGFVKGQGITFFEFGKSLSDFSGCRVVGIDYGHLAQAAPPADEPITAKAPVKKVVPKEKLAPRPPAIRDRFMRAALDEALKGLAEGGIPIGSALIRKGKLVAVGHNKRVQDNDPVTHAETDCLRNAGRLGSYRGCTLYSTLMPCYFCAGAAVQFGIKKVIVGESRTFPGASEFMREHGIEVVDLDLPQCYEMMERFIREHPDLWNEDIGVE